MNVPPIQPVEGVPQEFVRAVNDRLKRLAAQTGGPATISATHIQRLQNYPAADQVEKQLLIETDRHALYQVQNKGWTLVSGWATGRFSPDERPKDLGLGGKGFLFYATDTVQIFQWNGTAWNEAAPGPIDPEDLPNYASASYSGQTTGIGSTNLRHNGAKLPAGMYLLVYYYTVQVAASAGTIALSINWSDGTAARSTGGTFNLTGTAFIGGSAIMYTDGVGDVTYSGTFSGGVTGSPQYMWRIAAYKILTP